MYLEIKIVSFVCEFCYKNSNPKPTYSEALTYEKIMLFFLEAKD